MTGSVFCDFFEQLPGPTRVADLEGHFEFAGPSGVSAAGAGESADLVPGGGAPPRRPVHRRHLPDR